MLEVELKIINSKLNKCFGCSEIYLEDNILVEKATGKKTVLDDSVFSEIAEAKRCEYLRKTCNLVK